MSDAAQSGKLKPPDRFLKACPIRYDSKKLFICLVELDYSPKTKETEVILQYPENLKTQPHFQGISDVEFVKNIKKFAFPFVNSSVQNMDAETNSSLVEFYAFVFTDANRIRQYGFCRSTQNGNRILCLVSYLPWYNVFILTLNRLASILNEKDTTNLYNFLEALYEYDLPEPGSMAEIFSHDGLENISFICPDRRIIPSISENRNLLKFFAFFDLNKLIKIFTALLLERRILIVSQSLERICSCALSLEALIYPLEWLHAFAPLLPEHIDRLIFYQPFPYIYGVHTSIYKQLNADQLAEAVILMVDDHEVLNADKDELPKSLARDIHKKLKFFQSTTASRTTGGKMDNLLKTGPIKAFQDAVLALVHDYRSYVSFEEKSKSYRVNDDLFFAAKEKKTNSSSANVAAIASHNYFFREFRVTQLFEEFMSDRGDYIQKEEEYHNLKLSLQKDIIECLIEQYISDTKKFQKFIEMSKNRFTDFSKKATSAIDNLQGRAKEKILSSFNNNASNQQVDLISPSNSSTNIDSKKGLSVTKSSENIEKLSVYSSLSSDSSELSSDINLACLQQHMQMQGDLGKGRINVDLANDPDILKYLIDENGKDDDEPIILVDLSLPDSINNNAMAQPNQREMTVTPDGSASSFLIANDNNTKQKANTENENANCSNNELLDLIHDYYIFTSPSNSKSSANTSSIKSTNISQNTISNINNSNSNSRRLSQPTNVQMLNPQISSNNSFMNRTYESIINEFDPIASPSTSSVSTISANNNANNKSNITNNNAHHINRSLIDDHTNHNSSFDNSLSKLDVLFKANNITSNPYQQQQQHLSKQLNPFILPKPFQSATQNSQPQNPFISLPTQNSFYNQPYQPMSSSHQTRPVMNPFAATPFYGFNQRPQYGYHPVAYPSLNNNSLIPQSQPMQLGDVTSAAPTMTPLRPSQPTVNVATIQAVRTNSALQSTIDFFEKGVVSNTNTNTNDTNSSFKK